MITLPWNRDILGLPCTPVPFKNSSGETVPPFGIMKIKSDGLIANDVGDFVYEIEKPTSTFQTRYLVNGPMEVETGKYGTGSWGMDMVWARYSSGTPEWDKSWGATPSSWVLTKNNPGFQSLKKFKTDPDDTKRVLVRQREILIIRGETTEAIPVDDEGEVDVWRGPKGSRASTGFTVTATNWCVKAGKQIRSGDEVLAYFDGLEWIIFQVENCPETIPP